MTNCLKHRGPDDVGHCIVDTRSGRAAEFTVLHGVNEFAGDLHLGHRRLSIIDLSSAGHQPLHYGGKKFWITYNGELYNYVELGKELSRLGHRFSTRTDTEVIIAAYAEWGEECLKKFNGMFAFALWDQNRRTLFCARDRFGIKPFYYYSDANIFMFGSEIKALLIFPEILRRANDGIVYDYLVSRVVNHSPETFFDGILQIPPSHYLKIDQSATPGITRWWDVSPNRKIAVSKPEMDSFTRKFLDLFKDSVSLRLRSDVPVGTCLSGGLDSSSIVCIVNQCIRSGGIPEKVIVSEVQKTFSSCYKDLRFDERQYIQPVLERTGAANYQVFPEAERFWKELPDFVKQMDEPVVSTSPYAQWNVMRLVGKEGIKVVLDGQGSDELMGGYPKYNSIYVDTLLKNRMIVDALKFLKSVSEHKNGQRKLGIDALKTVYGYLPAMLQGWLATAPIFNLASVDISSQSLNCLAPDFKNRHRSRLAGWIKLRNRHYKNLSARLYDDVFHYYLPSLLRYEDRNSMAFSVEARVPFLDYRLVDLIFSMPLNMKINPSGSKWVLRNAMRGTLPEDVRNRKDKMGFVTPETVWLKQNIDQILALFDGNSKIGEFLDVDKVKGIVKRKLIPETVGNGAKDIWRWVNLESWMQVYL